MWAAVVSALGACALWALAFVAPALAGDGAAGLTVLRYTVFGLSSIAVLAACRFNPFTRLDLAGWARITGLGLTGNTLYFALVSAGVPAAGPAQVALVVGALPVALTLCGNLRRKTLAWRLLAGPGLVIAAAIGVNAVSTVRGIAVGDGPPLGHAPALGLGLAFAALVVWTVYGTWNAEYLQDNPTTNMLVWTSLIGMGTLLTLPFCAALTAWLTGGWAGTEALLEPTVLTLGLVLGLGASWGATWLWGHASSRLPAFTLGMLIVSETLFALLYTCLLEVRVPSAAETVAALLTTVGVLWGLRVSQTALAPAPASRCS